MTENKTTVKLLTAVLVLQGLTLAGQWTGQPRVADEVRADRADIPDPGAQRLAMVDELKQVNEKLERLVTLLESGGLKVKAESPDADEPDAK